MVERLFLAVLWGCLRFVIVVFSDHTPLLFINTRVSTSLHVCMALETVNPVPEFNSFTAR